MDFGWTDDQLARRAATRDFAQNELGNESLGARDREGRFARELWERCARAGILGLSVPAEFGGAEIDLPTAMLVMEGFGEGCADNGLAFALNAQLWTVQRPIVRFGTDEQKRRYLPGLCNGTLLGAHALTEPDAGSDAFSLTMRAEGTEVSRSAQVVVACLPIAAGAIGAHLVARDGEGPLRGAVFAAAAGFVGAAAAAFLAIYAGWVAI